MPHANPRLSVVVTPKLNATLKRLAGLQSRSKASIAREFLEEVEPVLSRVAGLLELAAKAKAAGTTWPGEFVAQIEAAQSDLEAMALGAMGQLDAFDDRIKAEAARTVPAPTTPPRTTLQPTRKPPTVTDRAKASRAVRAGGATASPPLAASRRRAGKPPRV